MTFPFARLLVRPVLLRAGAVLVLVEAVFLAEIFTSNLETVLRFEGTARDVAVLLILAMPGILDLGLPLAVLVGVFLAVGEARQRGELTVLAGAGVPWHRLIGFAAALGLGGAALSVGVSGVLVPNALYAQRVVQHQLEVAFITRTLTNAGGGTQVQQVGGYSFLPTGAAGATGQAPPLLILRDGPLDGADGPAGDVIAWRVAFAETWRVAGDPATGDARLELLDPVGYGVLFGRAGDRLSRVALESFEVGFDRDAAYPVFEGARRADEAPLVSVAALLRQAAGGPELERWAEALTRAALVPAAALLALLGGLVALVPRMRLLGLPLALGLMALGDIAGRVLLAGREVATTGDLLLVAGGFGGVVLALPLLALLLAGERLVVARARAD